MQSVKLVIGQTIKQFLSLDIHGDSRPDELEGDELPDHLLEPILQAVAL
jgi:hypothetical protein